MNILLEVFCYPFRNEPNRFGADLKEIQSLKIFPPTFENMSQAQPFHLPTALFPPKGPQRLFRKSFFETTI